MIGKAGEVGLGGMATRLGGVFVSSAGQQEKRQKHKSEAGKREGKQTKEKHKQETKNRVPLLGRAESDLRKGVCTLQLFQNPLPRGHYSLYFVVCPVFLT